MVKRGDLLVRLDDTAIRDSLGLILGMAGHEVRVAHGGRARHPAQLSLDPDRSRHRAGVRAPRWMRQQPRCAKHNGKHRRGEPF